MQVDQICRLRKCCCALFLALLIALGINTAHGQDQRSVNLELVLLVDVSASVNPEEFRLQTQGLAKAFESSAVIDAINSMGTGGLAVCVVQWADHEHQRKSVDWKILRNYSDALRFAEKIASMERLVDGGHTALGDALEFALTELRTNQITSIRQVIDLSGDGRSNDGRSLNDTRNKVLANGVTINGLAILNELPLLADYFRNQLIGGSGSFVETAQDYSDFARAMSRKLDREIRSAPQANNSRPYSGGKRRPRIVWKTNSNSIR